MKNKITNGEIMSLSKLMLISLFAVFTSSVFAAYGCQVGSVNILNGGSTTQQIGINKCEKLSCVNGQLTVTASPCKNMAASKIRQ